VDKAHAAEPPMMLRTAPAGPEQKATVFVSMSRKKDVRVFDQGVRSMHMPEPQVGVLLGT
jgi:hypothetical protein